MIALPYHRRARAMAAHGPRWGLIACLSANAIIWGGGVLWALALHA